MVLKLVKISILNFVIYIKIIRPSLVKHTEIVMYFKLSGLIPKVYGLGLLNFTEIVSMHEERGGSVVGCLT